MSGNDEEMKKVAAGVGGKYDVGKLQYGLIEPEFLEGIAEVLTSGAVKYSPGNWKKVANGPDRYYDALMRHLLAWKKGELLDPESGKPHLAHVACNVMFLSYFDAHGVQVP